MNADLSDLMKCYYRDATACTSILPPPPPPPQPNRTEKVHLWHLVTCQEELHYYSVELEKIKWAGGHVDVSGRTAFFLDIIRHASSRVDTNNTDS